LFTKVWKHKQGEVVFDQEKVVKEEGLDPSDSNIPRTISLGGSFQKEPCGINFGKIYSPPLPI
jgi:hypothetical protein